MSLFYKKEKNPSPPSPNPEPTDFSIVRPFKEIPQPTPRPSKPPQQGTDELRPMDPTFPKR